VKKTGEELCKVRFDISQKLSLKCGMNQLEQDVRIKGFGLLEPCPARFKLRLHFVAMERVPEVLQKLVCYRETPKLIRAPRVAKELAFNMDTEESPPDPGLPDGPSELAKQEVLYDPTELWPNRHRGPKITDALAEELGDTCITISYLQVFGLGEQLSEIKLHCSSHQERDAQRPEKRRRLPDDTSSDDDEPDHADVSRERLVEGRLYQPGSLLCHDVVRLTSQLNARLRIELTARRTFEHKSSFAPRKSVLINLGHVEINPTDYLSEYQHSTQLNIPIEGVPSIAGCENLFLSCGLSYRLLGARRGRAVIMVHPKKFYRGDIPIVEEEPPRETPRRDSSNGTPRRDSSNGTSNGTSGGTRGGPSGVELSRTTQKQIPTSC